MTHKIPEIITNQVENAESIKHQRKQKSGGRHRYFQMLIILGIMGMGPKLKFKTMDPQQIVQFLENAGFVSQTKLETSLYNLQIDDRRKTLSLRTFSGQLEFDSRGLPFWHIILETTTLTTARCIARAISKKLFQIENGVDPTIKVQGILEWKDLKKDNENILVLHHSEWYPGYFTQTTAKLAALLTIDEVQKAVHQNPEKYSLLLNKLLIPNPQHNL